MYENFAFSFVGGKKNKFVLRGGIRGKTLLLLKPLTPKTKLETSG